MQQVLSQLRTMTTVLPTKDHEENKVAKANQRLQANWKQQSTLEALE